MSRVFQGVRPYSTRRFEVGDFAKHILLSKETNAHPKNRKQHRSEDGTATRCLELFEILRQCRRLPLATERQKRASEILSASSGAGSVDFPTEELQIVPAPENNERAKGSLQRQGDKRNPRISRRQF